MTNLSELPNKPTINSKALKRAYAPAARIKLNGYTITAPIAIGTGSVLIHTCSDYAVDELYLWCGNYATSGTSHNLELEVGGDGTFSDLSKTISVPVPKQTGLMQVYPGIPHEHVTIYARADHDDHLNIWGYAVRHYRIDISDSELGYSGAD